MRTYTMELRVIDLDEEKQKILENAAKQAAKHLYATALLLSPDRKPEIALHSGDFFHSTTEIDLLEDVLAEDSETTET